MPSSDRIDISKKLNLKDTKNAYLVHAPKDYKLKVKNISEVSKLIDGLAWVQAFYDREDSLSHELPVIKEKLSKEGILWICWPKRASNKKTDLSDSVVRSLGLACGLVDTKVASINITWSGLKFVYRLSARD